MTPVMHELAVGDRFQDVGRAQPRTLRVLEIGDPQQDWDGDDYCIVVVAVLDSTGTVLRRTRITASRLFDNSDYKPYVADRVRQRSYPFPRGLRQMGARQ